MSETVYRKHAKMGSAVPQNQSVCLSVIVFITPVFFVTVEELESTEEVGEITDKAVVCK